MNAQANVERGNPASAQASEVPMASLSSLAPLTGKLAALAAQMELDPLSAVALPAAISSAAQKVAWSDSRMIAECFANAELREYLAGICRECDVAGALQ